MKKNLIFFLSFLLFIFSCKNDSEESRYVLYTFISCNYDSRGEYIAYAYNNNEYEIVFSKNGLKYAAGNYSYSLDENKRVTIGFKEKECFDFDRQILIISDKVWYYPMIENNSEFGYFGINGESIWFEEEVFYRLKYN